MKKNSIFIAAILGLASLSAGAQNDRDAFRYSMLNPTGTARYTALGGSMGAFGADFSTASTNPAALGTYNRSEFTISPSLYFGNTGIDYNGEYNSDYKTNFNLGNIGIVLTIPNDNGDWKAIQLSTGINRMGNFNTYSYASGPNMQNSSFADFVAEGANSGFTTNTKGDFVSGSKIGYMGWESYLLDKDANGNFYSNARFADLIQEKSTETKGSMNEYVISLSGNYQDRLFIGATLGIPYFSYKESYTYLETNVNAKNEAFNGLDNQSFLHSEGSGINFKFGMLYQPFNFLRIGFAAHTPTYYSVEENYDSYFIVRHDSIGTYEDYTSDGRFVYTINTPYRLMGNVAFIIGNYGFINVDYEMADYSVMRMRSETYSFRDENNMISKSYRVGHTIRIGGEINLSPLVLRAGYAYVSDPYVKQIGRDASKNILSAGFGFRGASNYIDFAYQYVSNTDNDVFYNKAPYAYTINTSNHSIVVTAGWKF